MPASKVEGPTANLTAWQENLLEKQRFIGQVRFPELVPGSCRVCGSAQKGPYLDTGHLEEFYGSVYYCAECFHEMALMMGYVKVDDEKVSLLEDYIQNLADDNASLRETIEGYGKVFDGVSIINSGSISEPPVHPVLVSSEQINARPQGTEENVGTGTRKVITPKHDENVGIVRPDIS